MHKVHQVSLLEGQVHPACVWLGVPVQFACGVVHCVLVLCGFWGPSKLARLWAMFTSSTASYVPYKLRVAVHCTKRTRDISASTNQPISQVSCAVHDACAVNAASRPLDPGCPWASGPRA